jgi:hypothetical protein
MDKFLKYVWLLELLYNKKDGMRLEDIKEQWDNNRNLREEGELDTRTFHRYRDRIEELFAVNISCEHYRYFISNRKDMENDNIRMWLLNTFSINNQVGKNGELRKRILFEEIPSGKYYLTDVIEAMRENRKIKIGYRKYRCDESKEYVLEPYFVKSFKKRWYMIAYDTEAEMVKTFSMDRVTEFFCTSETSSNCRKISILRPISKTASASSTTTIYPWKPCASRCATTRSIFCATCRFILRSVKSRIPTITPSLNLTSKSLST